MNANKNIFDTGCWIWEYNTHGSNKLSCPTFTRYPGDLVTNSFPIFHNALNAEDYQASCWQDSWRRKWKEDTVNKFSKQDFISITLWHRYSGSQDFIQPFHSEYVILNQTSVTKELFSALTECSPAKIQPAMTSFPASEFLRQRRLATTLLMLS